MTQKKVGKPSSKINDEIIQKIIELDNSKQKNKTEIANEFGITRQYVSKILDKDKNKEKNVSKKDCKDEDEFKEKFAKATSLGKRQFTFETAIQILLMKLDSQDNAEKIAKHFLQKDGKFITVDIVKNIWAGKTKFYEEEFDEATPISYEKYLEIIQIKRKEHLKNLKEKSKNDENDE